MYRWIVVVFCLLAAALGLGLGVMNPEPVQAHFPGLSLALPLGSLLVLMLVVGVVIGLLLFLLLFHLPSRWRRHRSAEAQSGTALNKPDA